MTVLIISAAIEAIKQWRSEGGEGGHTLRLALCMGRHLEGRKYGILKFGRFWRIGVCIQSINQSIFV